MKHVQKYNSNKTQVVQNSKNVIICGNQIKVFCIVWQVMQIANCAPTRGLGNALVDQLGMLLLHQVKPALNKKRTFTLCWAPYLLFIMPMNLYLEGGHAMNKLCTGYWIRHWKKMGWNWKKVEVGGIFLSILWYTQMAILVHMSVEPGSCYWALCV